MTFRFDDTEADRDDVVPKRAGHVRPVSGHAAWTAATRAVVQCADRRERPLGGGGPGDSGGMLEHGECLGGHGAQLAENGHASDIMPVSS
jgi:hypothetical protein